MKSAPPGWQPHKIVTRLDGWVIDLKNKNGVPARVAEPVARAMPQLTDPALGLFARAWSHAN